MKKLENKRELKNEIPRKHNANDQEYKYTENIMRST